jgi:hypothetical protein
MGANLSPAKIHFKTNSFVHTACCTTILELRSGAGLGRISVTNILDGASNDTADLQHQLSHVLTNNLDSALDCAITIAIFKLGFP